MDEDLTIPDFLDRKKNGITPEPLPHNVSWKLKNPNKIVWPAKRIERVMKAKLRAERIARKTKAKREAQKRRGQ
jgi:hypothetical protein